MKRNQFEFAEAWLEGKVLNVGSDGDPAGLSQKGSVTNLDVRPPADIVCDIRDYRLRRNEKPYDTILLCDLLHFFESRDEVLKVLRHCHSLLVDHGKVAISCPEDFRPVEMGYLKAGAPMYAPGVRAFRAGDKVTLPVIKGWLADAGGWDVLREEWIAYPFTHLGGWGVVAVKHPGTTVPKSEEISPKESQEVEA